jgi:hypothetical protein
MLHTITIVHLINRSYIYNEFEGIGQTTQMGMDYGYADCYFKGPGFESRVSHGPFQLGSEDLCCHGAK